MKESENITTEIVEETPVPPSKKIKKTKNNVAKIKLNLNAPNDHVLGYFLNEIKSRGVKNFDLNDFILEAISVIPKEWWKEKLESVTPLEYKINKALSNPKMREKLNDLLASDKNS